MGSGDFLFRFAYQGKPSISLPACTSFDLDKSSRTPSVSDPKSPIRLPFGSPNPPILRRISYGDFVWYNQRMKLILKLKLKTDIHTDALLRDTTKRYQQ